MDWRGTAGARTPLDNVLIRRWLDRRAPNTRRAYEPASKPLADITIAELQLWVGSLAGLAPASRARKIRAAKFLFRFAKRQGFLSADPAVTLRAPGTRRNSGDRTLTQADVKRLIARGPNRRNRAMLHLAYLAGLRVTDICALRWRHIQAEGTDGALMTVMGGRGESYRVIIPVSVLDELAEIRGAALPDEPVFRSAKGGALDPSQVHRIIKQAGVRAGLPAAFSTQWLRRAHRAYPAAALRRNRPSR
jgi:site-specific recombinase XerD